MSGSIGRSYLIQSWNDASSYSGGQIGNRLKASTDLYLANGKANIGLFEEKPVVKKKKSIADSIDLAERHFQKMEQLSIDLDEEYYAGEIDEETYELLRYKMDERLIKAFRRIEKENAPIWKKEDEKLLTQEQDRTKIQIKEKSFKSLVKPANKSLIDGNGWASMALKDCKETNLILIGICGILKLIKKLKGEI